MTAPAKVVFFDLGDTLVQEDPSGPRMKWMDGAKAALNKLSEESIPLGLISNTGNLRRDQLFDKLLPTDFDRSWFEERLIIFSSEIGAEKPKLRIFAHAIDQTGLAPVECLFCTENLSHSLAAQQMGVRAAWVQAGDLVRLVSDLLAHDLVDTPAPSSANPN